MQQKIGNSNSSFLKEINEKSSLEDPAVKKIMDKLAIIESRNSSDMSNVLGMCNNLMTMFTNFQTQFTNMGDNIKRMENKITTMENQINEVNTLCLMLEAKVTKLEGGFTFLQNQSVEIQNSLNNFSKEYMEAILYLSEIMKLLADNFQESLGGKQKNCEEFKLRLKDIYERISQLQSKYSKIQNIKYFPKNKPLLFEEIRQVQKESKEIGRLLFKGNKIVNQDDQGELDQDRTNNKNLNRSCELQKKNVKKNPARKILKGKSRDNFSQKNSGKK